MRLQEIDTHPHITSCSSREPDPGARDMISSLMDPNRTWFIQVLQKASSV